MKIYEFCSEIAMKIFIGFSVFHNIPKIVNMNHSKGSFTSIHGMKAVTVSWVVLGHTFLTFLIATGDCEII